MRITTTSSRPFEKVILDIVKPLIITLSDNICILTMQDDLIKYLLSIPLLNFQANTVAEALIFYFYCAHDIHEIISTDQGIELRSKTFT